MDKIEKGNNGAPIGQSSQPTVQRPRDEDDTPALRRAEPFARLVPMALCVAALVVMLKNSETNDSGSVSYSDLGAFRFINILNALFLCLLIGLIFFLLLFVFSKLNSLYLMTKIAIILL